MWFTELSHCGVTVCEFQSLRQKKRSLSYSQNFHKDFQRFDYTSTVTCSGTICSQINHSYAVLHLFREKLFKESGCIQAKCSIYE